MSTLPTITVQATIHKNLDLVWDYWTNPNHITHWNFASDDWKCPQASNDLRVGGQFSYAMAAKDGSVSFDFGGFYTEVIDKSTIKYELEDGRKVIVLFETIDENTTLVTETFDPETENPLEMQQAGWQSILDNFKKYTEKG